MTAATGIRPAASESPALDLLRTAWRKGLNVFARGDQLVIQGPASSDQAFLLVLMAHKAALLPIVTLADEAEREWFEERAAIAEFDGGLNRANAERQAWGAVLRRRQELP